MIEAFRFPGYELVLVRVDGVSGYWCRPDEVPLGAVWRNA